MSHSTISFASIVESIGSSDSPARVIDPALVINSESEPFENPASPVESVASEIVAEPLGSPATSDYYDGSKFFLETILLILLWGQMNHHWLTLHPHFILRPIQIAIGEWVVSSPSPSPPPSPLSPLPAFSPRPSPPHSRPSSRRSCPSSPPSYSPHPTSSPRKRCRVSSCSSPLPSVGPSLKRCRSPSPAAPASTEVALASPTLPSIPTNLLPPRKRFGAIERVDAIHTHKHTHTHIHTHREREDIETLRARLAAAEGQIAAHQRHEIVESIGSSDSPTRVIDPALVINSESEPFENPASPVESVASEIVAEPLGSPATSDYYDGSEFFE
nr:hypothetical protein [Tanacetum cinerariifolium]